MIRRYHAVPVWACGRCSSTRASVMSAHVFPDGSSITCCSPECLELYLTEKDSK